MTKILNDLIDNKRVVVIKKKVIKTVTYQCDNRHTCTERE